MNRNTKSLGKKIIAVVVVVAMLQVVGVSTALLFFLTGVGFIVWRIARSAENRETHRIFKFYIAADEMLRNDGREWYGFEMGEVIEEGDRILDSMSDAPTLCYFATGALSNRVGDHESAVHHLSPILDTQWLDERRRATPSPELRRYVELLRELEREPATAPQALGAVRNLERMRQKYASQMLEESSFSVEASSHRSDANSLGASRKGIDRIPTPTESFNSFTAPRPIAEVLHDVYEDQQKAS